VIISNLSVELDINSKNKMKRFSLMWKQFLRFFIIIIFTAGLIVYFASREIRNNYLENLEQTLENYAQLIEKFIQTFVAENMYSQIEEITRQMGNELDVRCTVIDRDGVVLGDSEQEPALMDNHKTRPEISAALQVGYGSRVRYSNTLEKKMLYVAVPIVYNDQTIGVVRVSSFVKIIQRSIREITQDIIGITLVIIVLALLFSIITTRSYTKPLGEITRAADSIKEGDFKTRLYIRRSDELGMLAESLNEMARELEQYFTSLNQEREGLNTILASMVEALVVLKPDGSIAIANNNFARIIDDTVDNVIGKRYWECIRQNEFEDIIEEDIQREQCITKELKIKNRIYLTSCSLIQGVPEKRIIVVMHDITDLKRLEEVKSDFVANVAHELKTPLTAIKGFAETLEDEVSDVHKRFLKIIRTNTDRLINIVSDLLVLSKLEHTKDTIERQQFDLEKLIQNSLLIEQNKIEEKHIDVTFDFEETIEPFYGDPFLIEQMMINLLDNAITYSNNRGKIIIDVAEEDSILSIVIEDTGSGIPEEHFPRIFERFYVVDTSRSRNLGGTGLGLSIVKHIVQAHQGEIQVESTLGKGTSFIITFPVITHG